MAPTDKQPEGRGKPDPASERERKLAEALRANLRRRKAERPIASPPRETDESS